MTKTPASTDKLDATAQAAVNGPADDPLQPVSGSYDASPPDLNGLLEPDALKGACPVPRRPWAQQCAQGYPRFPPLSAAGGAGRRQTAPNRPFHKPGAGCTACPRCWRSRRSAVSSSCPIGQTTTPRCICSSTPTTYASAMPRLSLRLRERLCSWRPSAALSEIVQRAVGVSKNPGSAGSLSSRETSSEFLAAGPAVQLLLSAP
jgi:hypothetical protein